MSVREIPLADLADYFRLRALDEQPAAERGLWLTMAGEVDAYLTEPQPSPDVLFPGMP